MSSNRITPAQRATLVRLMGKAAFDDRTITLMHRTIGVPETFQGRRVDEWLDSLTAPEASRFIVKLENRNG